MARELTAAGAVTLDWIGDTLYVSPDGVYPRFPSELISTSCSRWTNRTAFAHSQLPLIEMTTQVIERAKMSVNPKEIPPGTYPVVFHAAAVSSLIPWVIWNLDARAADEGRSFMSRMNEKGQPMENRVGESMFSTLIEVVINAAHPLLQSGTFFRDGMRNEYLEVIKKGIPKTLSYSRYWGQHQGKKATGAMYPIVMKGSEESREDLIKGTERGYVNCVNPRTLEVTGMTRDGTFLLEDGKIAYPINNLRFNQSLPEMLKNVEAVSEVQRFGSTVVPGMRVSAFKFSSVSDSI